VVKRDSPTKAGFDITIDCVCCHWIDFSSPAVGMISVGLSQPDLVENGYF